MKNFLNVIDDLTKFIIGEDEPIEEKDEKVFGFSVNKKRKYKRKKKNGCKKKK